MSIYIALFILSAFIILIEIRNSRTEVQSISDPVGRVFSASLFSAMLAILLIMYLFRSVTVGTDYWMYRDFFFHTNDFLKANAIEPAYLMLYKYARILDSFYVVSLTSIVIFLAGYFIVVRRFGLNRLLSLSMLVLSYVFFMTFNTMRAMTAIAIVWMGLAIFFSKEDQSGFSVKRKIFNWLGYFSFILLATQFHNSAFIAIIIPITMRFKVHLRTVVICGLITTILFFSRISETIVPRLIQFVPHYVEKYGSDTNEFFSSGSKGLIEFLPILIQFIILFLICLYDKKFIKSNNWVSALYLTYLVLFSAGGNSVVTRMQDYWVISSVIFYVEYFQKGKRPVLHLSRTLFTTIIVCFWIAYAFIKLFRNNSGIVPFAFG